MNISSTRHRRYREVERLVIQLRIARLQRRRVVVACGSDAQFIDLPRLSLGEDTELKIGALCILRSKSDSNPIGIDQPITFCTLAAGAQIVIGQRVGISGGTFSTRALIEIDDGTLIGAYTYIFDNDFHPLEPGAWARDAYSKARFAPGRIGSNVFVGARSTILKGVTIGDNAIVGAGSVVSQSIPANAIAAANPCKVRGQPLVPNAK